MLDNKIRHLEFIQNIISRMNKNSFQLKGWMITIVSALLALYASANSICFIWIAIVPTSLFWFMDAYYLQQERKFIGIYNDIAELSLEDERIAIREFEMPTYKYKGGKYCYFNVLISKTLAGLYGLTILGLIIAGISLG